MTRTFLLCQKDFGTIITRTMESGEPIQVHSSNPTPSSSPRPKSSTWKTIREWVQVIIIALVISLPIRFFIAEPFVVNGASMDPTFSTGQFLIVDRVTYRFEKPQRGDVMIFQYPYAPVGAFGTPDVYYIKRVIGLPGETVTITDGRVFVSTGSSTPVELNEPYISPMHASHDNYTTTLGPTQYFVMGDNRAESSDSRAWGPLDQKYIVGRPVVRLLPLNTLSILPGKANE